MTLPKLFEQRPTKSAYSVNNSLSETQIGMLLSGNGILVPVNANLSAACLAQFTAGLSTVPVPKVNLTQSVNNILAECVAVQFKPLMKELLLAYVRKQYQSQTTVAQVAPANIALR